MVSLIQEHGRSYEENVGVETSVRPAGYLNRNSHFTLALTKRDNTTANAIIA